MEERRKYIRIPEKSQISYDVIPTKKTGQYMTSDIGQGGIRFMVHHFMPVGSHLKVQITFVRNTTLIEALVKVMWIRELPYSGSYEVGVQFVDIPSKAVEHLINYIKQSVTLKSGMSRNK